MRDTLNLIHQLAERGVGVRNLADPIRVDSSDPGDPMASLAVVLLALFGRMERAYASERAAHARAVAAAEGRRVGRPSVVDPDELAWAAHLRDAGHTVAGIVAKTGIARTSLYRHRPPRPAEPDPQLSGRIGFAHRYRPLSTDELAFVLARHRERLGLAVDADDFTDTEAVAAVARITGGNFRLIERLFAQVRRVLETNRLRTITREVVEAARDTLAIGA